MKSLSAEESLNLYGKVFLVNFELLKSKDCVISEPESTTLGIDLYVLPTKNGNSGSCVIGFTLAK